MRGETHYEGGTHIASWALGREIPRRRRGWAPRRGSPCASPFAAALAVSEEFEGPEPMHLINADLLVQDFAPNSCVSSSYWGKTFDLASGRHVERA